MSLPTLDLPVVVSTEELESIHRRLADEINKDYEGIDTVYALCVLKGAAMFYTDLVRRLKIKNVCYDFLYYTSYPAFDSKEGCGRSSRLHLDASFDLRGKHVLVIEDIYDTGETMEFLLNHLRAKKPASIKIACLLSKRADNSLLNYLGRVISPDIWVIGYGFDYKDFGRNYPTVYALNQKTE